MIRRLLLLAPVLLAACTAGGSFVSQPDEPAPVEIPDGMSSLPWRLERVDGARITVTVMSGGCSGYERMAAEEGATAVRLAALAREARSGADEDGVMWACTADLRMGPASVTLSAPLGERDLIHEPIDPNWDRHPDATDEWRGVERAPHPSG